MNAPYRAPASLGPHQLLARDDPMSYHIIEQGLQGESSVRVRWMLVERSDHKLNESCFFEPAREIRTSVEVAYFQFLPEPPFRLEHIFLEMEIVHHPGTATAVAVPHGTMALDHIVLPPDDAISVETSDNIAVTTSSKKSPARAALHK